MKLLRNIRRSLFDKSIKSFGNPTKLPIASAMDLLDIRGKQLELDDYLMKEMKEKGPMSFNKFMEHCLLHSEHGYYMKRDVFNAKGDFITSPEISQMFGEMFGLWIAMFLDKIGKLQAMKSHQKDKKIRLLEIGPGRGTLMADILRTLGGMGLLNGIEINFIEFSPVMRQMQQENVQKVLQENDYWLTYELENKRNKAKLDLSLNSNKISDDRGQGQRVESFINGDQNRFLELHWYKTYEEFLQYDLGDQQIQNDQQAFNEKNEECPIIVIAHELFDALPVHIFRHNGNTWQEQMVDIDENTGSKYRMCEGEREGESVKKVLNPEKTFSEDIRDGLVEGDQIEISTQAAVLMHSLSELISKENGAILVVDYGEDHAFSDSVRGIRRHKYLAKEDLLESAGEADLSVYVNFQQLRTVAEKISNVKAYPTLTQGGFLEAMGITTRVDMLGQGKSLKVKERLESEYQRLTHKDHMGQIYKVMYVGNIVNGEVFPFMDPDGEKPDVYE